MPYRLMIFERRDNASREEMANTALAICKGMKKVDGINSAKFYWSGLDNIVFLTEGTMEALNSGGGNNPDIIKLAFDLSDLTKQTMNILLAEPRAGEEAYRSAGR